MFKKTVSICLGICFIVVLIGCSGSKKDEKKPAPAPTPAPAPAPAPVKTFTNLAITGPNRVNENTAVTYLATAYWNDGSSQVVKASWSEDSSYASIDSAGVLTASEVNSDQKCMINASYFYGGSTKTAGLSITIANVQSLPTLTGLTITGPAQIPENSSANFVARASFNDGTTNIVTSAATWSDSSIYAAFSVSGTIVTLDVPNNQTITIQAVYATGGITKTANFQAIITDTPQAIVRQANGFDFSPFIEPQDPNLGSFISEQQIRDRLVIIKGHTKWIRYFGSTHGLEETGWIAQGYGLKVAGSAWLDKNPATNRIEMNNLIAKARNGFIDLAVVGSEVLLRGDLTEGQLLTYIDEFRQAVPGVPVTSGEVYSVLLSHPNLMAACDIIFVNHYPYWEGKSIDNAIAYLHACHQEIIVKSGGKEVIVSETGWPSAGNQIGDAVPSPDNAAYHFLNFVSWAEANNVPYFYFEAFDEAWKAKYEGEQGAHWGVWDKTGILKPGMQDVFDGLSLPDNWSCRIEPGGLGTPEIEFVSVPPKGSFDNLSGQVWHVAPSEYRIAVYIKVGGWWTKPFFASPKTSINCDGSWVCDITTGGSDQNATEIIAFLIPVAYEPPPASGGALSNDLYVNALDYISVAR